MATSKNSEPLVDALTSLRDLARGQRDVRTARGFEDLREQASGREFRLAVAGQFKRGKSTLLNALIGRPLLPMDVLPLTSVPAFLRDGPDFDVRVRFQSGTVTSVAPEDLDDYATERGNPGNRRGVERIDITVPDRVLVPNLCLIDLPGVGSTITANSIIARETLGQIDAVLFVTGADPPITDGERAFLAEVARDVPRVFVVQNKRDLFEPEEWDRALQWNAAAISDMVDAADIFPVSAREALRARLAGDADGIRASGWGALEARLGQFLLEERYPVWQASMLTRAAALVGPVLEALAVRRAALSLPLETLSARYRELEARAQDLHRVHDDAAVLFRRDLDREMRAMTERLQAWTHVCTLEAARNLRDPGIGGPHDVNAQLVEVVAASARDVTEREEQRWQEWWAEHVHALADRGRELLHELQDTYQAVLGVEWTDLDTLHLPPVAFRVRVTDLDRQSFFPEVSWGSLAPIMPARLRRAIRARLIADRLPVIVDRFRGRIRQTFAQALETAAQTFLDQFDGRMRETESRLIGALAQTLQELEGTKRALPDLRDEAERVEDAWLRAWENVREALGEPPRRARSSNAGDQDPQASIGWGRT
jgi:hypothetical protein